MDKGVQPIPMGAKFGNIVYSSPIPPEDPDLGVIPADPDAQAVALFKNIRAFAQACGGSPENIVYMSLSVRDPKVREYLNPEWVKMFPDENSRPARRILVQARQREGNRVGETLFHADLVLVLG